MQPDFAQYGFAHQQNLIMACIGGSQAHGAKVGETDDTDWYGLYIPPAIKVLGLEREEHFVFTTGGKTGGNGPQDVDVLQAYENFTGGVVMSLVEHGFCDADAVMDYCTYENFAWPNGKLPLNTSGGNLAECYMHGLELVLEAVRQVRGTSTCQVKDAEISMVVSGPMVTPVSSLILHA